MSCLNIGKRKEVILSLINDVKNQGFISPKLFDLVKDYKYVSWIDHEGNTILHHISFYMKNSCYRAKCLINKVAENIIESTSIDIIKVLLFCKNSDNKTVLELAINYRLNEYTKVLKEKINQIIDQLVINTILDMEKDYKVGVPISNRNEVRNHIQSVKFDQVRNEHNYSAERNKSPSSRVTDLVIQHNHAIYLSH
ncbi:hypothetical protein [Wolbachia endosymbiont of Pentidionis agamae]|uniref:hypothetical protein n=1 Tax=Wolbachia endosymbiont of Pentidionis agamae TaxID=3110435 RepID=UPI002FD71F7B